MEEFQVDRGDPEEDSDMMIAMEVGRCLDKRYPDHPWVVSFQGGALVIRHLAIADAVHNDIGQAGFGAILPREKLGTPKQIAQTAMEFGGQLLEAFGLTRGKWDGSKPVTPKNWKYKQVGSFH